MKPINTDEIGYEAIIKEALPGALIEYVDNYDDINFGWDICPTAGIILQLMVYTGDQMKISINIYMTILYYPVKTEFKRVYSGRVPTDENLNPDLNFIKQLLKNWNCLCL